MTVSSIDEMCAVLNRHLIEPDERTDCTIVYRVTFDQLRNLYDSGRALVSTPAASLREQEGDEPRTGFLNADYCKGFADGQRVLRPDGAAYKWGYEYLQSRMESIERHGWAHDCDEEIAQRLGREKE